MGPYRLESPARLVVGAFAVHRLTRLLTEDEITRPLRAWAEARGGRVAYLATCPWCVSLYAAAGWALLSHAAPAAVDTAGPVLAWSSAAGLLSSVT